MPVSTTAWVTSFVFGLILGWTLGRRAHDRMTVFVGSLLTAAIGGVVWASGPTAGTEPAMAAVSMTLGGLATALSAQLAGRRSTP